MAHSTSFTGGNKTSAVAERPAINRNQTKAFEINELHSEQPHTMEV